MNSEEALSSRSSAKNTPTIVGAPGGCYRLSIEM
jgi:hypothetical protein